MKQLWKDRRPIGAMHVASYEERSESNPAGWFSDKLLDARDRKVLRAKFTDYAHSAVAVVKEVNAQGIIVWEIDGLRYGPYLGCPDLATTLNPELEDGVAYEFFKIFKSAGLSVGCCIRPSEYDFASQKLRVPQDYYRNLLFKAKFANETWGCTLFYVDTNMENLGENYQTPNGPVAPAVLASEIFETLHREMPGCLFIPEHENIDYHLWTAPYRELRMGEVATPQNVLDDIPEAFSVIMVNCDAEDGSLIRANVEGLKARKGKDIVMANMWWKSGDIEEIIKFEA